MRAWIGVPVWFLVACGSQPAEPAAAPLSAARVADVPSASAATPPAPVAGEAIAAGPPASELSAGAPPACEKSTVLTPPVLENAAWVADLSHNVAYGLQALSCQQMARDHGPVDFFGEQTFVACSPPRLCSAGQDNKRGTADDACTELVEGESTGKREMPKGWERHFLMIREDMHPGCGTPAAAVVQFYASLMRRDDDYLAVLPPKAEWDERLQRKLKKHAHVYFRGVRLDGMRCGGDRCQFEIFMTISHTPDGKTFSGRDQGTLKRVGDQWLVEYPPT